MARPPIPQNAIGSHHAVTPACEKNAFKVRAPVNPQQFGKRGRGPKHSPDHKADHEANDGRKHYHAEADARFVSGRFQGSPTSPTYGLCSPVFFMRWIIGDLTARS